MKRLTILWILVSFLGAFGCSDVYMEAPIGEKLKGTELSKFNGIWLLEGEGVLFAKANAKGEMKIAAVEWDKEDEKFAVDQQQIVPTRIGKLDVAFFREKDQKPDRFLVALYRWEGSDKIVCSMPIEKLFLTEVKEGRLKGKLEKNKTKETKVILSCTAEEFQSFVEKQGVKACFDSKDTLEFKKISTPDW